MSITRVPGHTEERAFDERRREPRQRALKGGVLTFNRGFSTFECVARNLSGRGARLSMGEVFAVPTTFTLQLQGWPPMKATARWRSDTGMGVELEPA